MGNIAISHKFSLCTHKVVQSILYLSTHDGQVRPFLLLFCIGFFDTEQTVTRVV